MFSISNDSRVYIPGRKWQRSEPPKRVLAIRLQAMGDLVVTLPYLQQLRNNLPVGSQLDLLTRKEVQSIPKNLRLFNHVYSIGGGRNWKKQLLLTCLMLPKLFLRRYDIVIDLQNNIISKTVRKSLLPAAWSEFDRYSPVPAGECTRLTIEACGLPRCNAQWNFTFKTNHSSVPDLLKLNGWKPKNQLILLNPAGAFANRNWPLRNYVRFAWLWRKTFPHSQFLLMGTEFIAKKADFIKYHLGDACINLVGKTTPAQAFGFVPLIQLALSEDSGLMHMTWVSGIPTLALFGTTTGVRASPLGNHSKTLLKPTQSHGNCVVTACPDDQNQEISSYSVPFVFEAALNLLRSVEQQLPATVFTSSVKILKPQ